MKTKLLISFVFITSVFLGLDNKSLYAFQYKGEVTWSYHRTQDDAGSTNEYYTAKCGISYVGGAYYILQGRFDSPGENSCILSGSAIVEGNNLMVTMHGSHQLSNGITRTMILYANIDKTTFNGTAWGNTNDFDPFYRIMFYGYTAGTLTLTSSPIRLATSPPPVQMLLE